jgi:hypothetical protein
MHRHARPPKRYPEMPIRPARPLIYQLLQNESCLLCESSANGNTHEMDDRLGRIALLFRRRCDHLSDLRSVGLKIQHIVGDKPEKEGKDQGDQRTRDHLHNKA